MHELTLANFFEGKVTDADLLLDLQKHPPEKKNTVTHYRIVDADGNFQVEPLHLVKLCDAVISGRLEPNHLEEIGFCLIASDFFEWDGDAENGGRVGETANDWASPDINYPLTLDNVFRFRERLLTGRDTFKM